MIQPQSGADGIVSPVFGDLTAKQLQSGCPFVPFGTIGPKKAPPAAYVSGANDMKNMSTREVVRNSFFIA